MGRPTEDLVLMDNVITKASAGGVAVGSEVSGGIRRVYVLNTTITKATIACYVKSMPGRGAYVQDIYVRDVVADQVKECITVNANFKNPSPKPPPAQYRADAVLMVKNGRSTSGPEANAPAGNSTSGFYEGPSSALECPSRTRTR